MNTSGQSEAGVALRARPALIHGHRRVLMNTLQILNEVRERAPWQLAWLVYQVAELITSTTVLSIVWQTEQCTQQPLKPWIMLYSGRLIARIPLTVAFINYARIGQLRIPTWLNLVDTVLLIYMMFTWFLGNLWFYSSTVCRTTAPISYIYAVVLIGLIYLYLSIPIIFCIGMCLCFPLILICMHTCGIGEKGATNRMIAKLTHRKYDGRPISRPDGTVNEFGAQCAICMNEFQIGAEITTLPCGHTFDRECIQRWLRVKRICALCRHDITQPGNAQP